MTEEARCVATHVESVRCQVLDEVLLGYSACVIHPVKGIEYIEEVDGYWVDGSRVASGEFVAGGSESGPISRRGYRAWNSGRSR